MQELTQIQLYQSHDGVIKVNAHIEHDTIWLTEQQMGMLFAKARNTISEHISHIYAEGELTKEESMQKISHVGKTDIGLNKPTTYYNLDVIISVGYRVKSPEGVTFRKRANSILRQHILKGYTTNTIRLKQTGLEELHETINLVKKALATGELGLIESQGLVELMTKYIPSMITLNQFDTDSLPIQGKTNEQKYHIDQQEAMEVLQNLKTEMLAKGEATDLFALPRDSGLDSILGAVYQGFGGQDVYATVEEKAANLLYLIIKNHPFADGNKRSGAFLFVRYLAKNNILYDANGIVKISERTLVALALLVAQSDPQQKELMVRLVMSLL